VGGAVAAVVACVVPSALASRGWCHGRCAAGVVVWVR
jgi:hypothetical protein